MAFVQVLLLQVTLVRRFRVADWPTQRPATAAGKGVERGIGRGALTSVTLQMGAPEAVARVDFLAE